MKPRKASRTPRTGRAGSTAEFAGLVLPGIAYAVVFLGLALAAFTLPGMERMTDWSNDEPPAWAQPDAEHWFGLDGRGRDLMAAVLGSLGRSSLLALVATLLGVGWGGGMAVAVALLFPRSGRRWMRRLQEQIVLFPALVFVVLSVDRWGSAPMVVGVSLAALVAWWVMGEISGWIEERAEEGAVIAGRAMGASRLQVLADGLAPQILKQAAGLAAVLVPSVLLLEAAIGFSGVGSAEKAVFDRIGEVIAAGRPFRFDAPWLIFYPGLSLTVLSILLATLGWVVRKSTRQPISPRWF